MLKNKLEMTKKEKSFKKMGVKIMSLDGTILEKLDDAKDNTYVLDTKAERSFINNKTKKEVKYFLKVDKLYKATMGYSLETIRAFAQYNSELLNHDLEVASDDTDTLFTKLFINFEFNKQDYEEVEVVNEETEEITKEQKKISKTKVRKNIYKSKVIVDGVEYRFFKRGASKARTASVIFCKKEFYDTLFNPCLLGLKFEKDELCDLTSLEAYISLIMSGIIGTIDIKREEILIVNDLYSKEFEALQTITTLDGQSEPKMEKVVNNMTDGQGLADESLFAKNELLETATTALLRNDFTKVNVLRTRLQEYYEKNKITKVYDKFLGEVDASKIRLVITPSSCKYLKFKSKFNNNETECYKNWLENINSTFGIVKINHAGSCGKSYPLSYQMINSMNFSKDEMCELMKDELKYLKLLKDNTVTNSKQLRKFTKPNKKEQRILRNDMTEFISSLDMREKEDFSTSEMTNELLKRNANYRFTAEFKDYKSKQIAKYIDNMRLGKIRIQNSLYAIMVSCPFQMLLSTTKVGNKLEKEDFTMTGNECWCPYYGEGEQLLSIRNPHIMEGNVNYMVNKEHEEYKWFGYWEESKNEKGEIISKPKFDEVVFCNANDFDIMNKLSGQDWDVDSTYLSNNKLLVSKAILAQSKATPVNAIEGTTDPKKYNSVELAKLDNYLGQSTLTIGKIVNKSAIFNAYMYNGINNGKNQDYADSCYKASSTLSSYSQIAIDMAKKVFKDELKKPISLSTKMTALNKTVYKNDNDEFEQILQFDYDKEYEDVELGKLIADDIRADNDDSYIRKFITAKTLRYSEDEFKKDKKAEKYKVKEKALVRKMIVPRFFKYTAKDNSSRIPTPFQCGMDYLEQILDDFDTKAMKTDVKDINELINTDIVFENNISTKKIDEVRVIINTCNSTLNQNTIKANDSKAEKAEKGNLIRYAKNKAINRIKKLELNDKTIYTIILRAFSLDKKYEGKEIKILDKEEKEIIYTKVDKETGEEKEMLLVVKELSEMRSLVLTLIYNAFTEKFLECFKEEKLEIKKNQKFWR